MRPETKQSLHFGVNYILAPRPIVDGNKVRGFQSQLAREGIEFTDVQVRGNAMRLQRREPTSLRVQVGEAQQPLGQLLIVAAHPNRPLQLFQEDAGLVCAAFSAVWPARTQVVARDCTIRSLYVAQGEHAFKYLWEERLQQPPQQLERFGRPVLGGGLRFVIPADDQQADSLLPKRKLVHEMWETAFLWVHGRRD